MFSNLLKNSSGATLFCPVALLTSAVGASPVVLNFDDLATGTILSGGSYAGLIWEQGNPGFLGAPGLWVVPQSTSSFPHSVPHNIVNGNGSTLIGVGFPAAVDIGGAYVAAQGANTAWAQSLRVHGYFSGQPTVDTPLFTQISSTPTWFDMTALTHVDRIVFEASIAIDNEAYYGLDDLTFTYVPEPAGISLGLLALGGLLLRRRGR